MWKYQGNTYATLKIKIFSFINKKIGFLSCHNNQLQKPCANIFFVLKDNVNKILHRAN